MTINDRTFYSYQPQCKKIFMLTRLRIKTPAFYWLVKTEQIPSRYVCCVNNTCWKTIWGNVTNDIIKNVLCYYLFDIQTRHLSVFVKCRLVLITMSFQWPYVMQIRLYMSVWLGMSTIGINSYTDHNHQL